MQILLYLVGKSHMDYPVKEMFPLFIFLNLFESLHIFQNTFFLSLFAVRCNSDSLNKASLVVSKL